MQLAGKTVVLTGASRGIGRALAMGLAREGCRLLLSALEGDELAALAEQVRSAYPVEVAALATDLTNAADRRRLTEWVESQPQPLDVLINNAGGGLFGRLDGLTWPQIEAQLLLNIHASTHLTHALLPILKSRPEAKIVNMSSGVARLPYPGLAVYGAAKGFVSSLSESLACELAGSRVRVLCFHPGFTETAFIGTARMDMSKIPRLFVSTPEKVAARIISAIRKDRQWAYGDLATRLGAFLTCLIPGRMRTLIFKDLFWELPRET